MELLPQNASPLKLYRQAKRLLKSTSRAKEPDWYRGATELNLQWHLWIGTQSGQSAIYSRSLKQWWTGPDLPAVSFETDDHGGVIGLDKTSRDNLHELVRKILAAKEFGAKAKSLGIIIHLADGIRIRDLAPDFASDPDFPAVNELLMSAPEIALGDDTVDNREGKWRLLPLLGIPDGEKRSLAVQCSARLEMIADEFAHYGELRNIPVVVNARSAPLEALAGIAYLHPEIQTAGTGAILTLIQYDAMTLVSATGNRGELLLVRPLFHRNATHLSQSETQEVLSQTAALLNIKDAYILYVSASGLPEERLRTLMEAYLDQFPKARYRCINVQSEAITEGIPGRHFEFAVATQSAAPTSSEPPFQKELREKWAFQDFYGPNAEEAARMPSRADLQMLKLSGHIQKVAIIGILAYCGWAGTDFFTKMRSEAWKISPEEATGMDNQLAALQKEKKEWQHWEQLLEKRSEGWLVMETLLEIFPADGGVILRDMSYRAETESSGKGDKGSLGLKRFIDINGFANPEVAVNLPTLGSRNRVAELLNSIAEKNHAPYLSVAPATRDLQVVLQQRQGAMPPSQEFPAKVARHFRTSFSLNIAQSLNEKDELAIAMAPPEPKKK